MYKETFRRVFPLADKIFSLITIFDLTTNKIQTKVIKNRTYLVLSSVVQLRPYSTRFFYKKLGSGHSTKSFLIQEILSILVLKVS